MNFGAFNFPILYNVVGFHGVNASVYGLALFG
jgi:hypothetical protein